MQSKSELLKQISQTLQINGKQVENVIALLEEGNTVPFIARYRKEQTGALDEVQIKDIMDSWQYLQNLETRKEEVIRLIDEQGKLTEDLRGAIQKATILQKVEDLYRPYKQKRRTKAVIAKEKGLEPLADWLLTFPKGVSIEEKAASFMSEEFALNSPEECIQGAKDIIAESVADDADYRQWIRETTYRKGTIESSVKGMELDEKRVYEMYYEHEEAVAKVVPHRVLAMNRGEKEDILRIAIRVPQDIIVSYLYRKIITNEYSPVVPYVKEAIEDSYKRLIQPSVEREIRKELTEKAEDRAIHIFAENLQNLLLQPPLKGKIVLGVDPAYRTGCKLAVVDATGKVLHIGVIYPHPPKNQREESKRAIKEIISKYGVEVIAIGNGTASRETETLIAEIIQQTDLSHIFYIIVNEAGASVYSASEIAREEFPNLQVEERSAVSIARRLQDPLAELVKIDPKSVGVGQYQHDVSQKKLNESLTFVVETAVNKVGVNVNTASPSLLQYVAGLSKSVAANIVKRREEAGRFDNRAQLKNIPRLGAKTYEQAVGFMRVLDGDQPLDQTSIHPESYKETMRLLALLKMTTDDLGSQELKEAISSIDLQATATELGMGELTLQDIVKALMQPGRDPRDDLPKPLLKKDILQLEDLKRGMELEGTVRNVVDFGAFVDIGVKQDGLVHISKLSKGFVKHPLDVVSVGMLVKVWVEDVDVAKGRVSLTMLEPAAQV
ncbi:RNA-binding transcriptional accessory protein [Bacillus sp. HMF5848]|uniref:Tex family protein n=1 Tax=Bacillus sp. HMF5848 TaxID=2495421 RepID=UPI000F7B54F6|nr:Tex family protein [Bacillus sp. HMF5848]RSK25668.1 RNA-binding transcriptional accessory protein [Bacillus sp. HMF5848]